MLKTILKSIIGGRGAADRPSTKTRTYFGWRCTCGGNSRGGWGRKADAEYAAQRHQWSKGVGHQMPETYSFEEEVPGDWP
jgi:hypothetical protein